MRPGGPAPWAHLAPSQRRPTVADVRAAFAAAGPPHGSSLEPQMRRASAVLAAVYDDGGEAHVVLTRRAWHLRAHKGEVSFPGGGREPHEALVDTARREAQEEVGLDPATVEVIGELDHLSTFSSGSFIVPFVAVLPGRPELKADPAEVEAILLVSLSELLRDDVFHEERWTILGEQRSIFFFEVVGDTIWGATAALLRQLLGMVTGTVGRGQLRHA
jgi:8-oxo-dGTP pyrophosphatase MutT (NUDIX family)